MKPRRESIRGAMQKAPAGIGAGPVANGCAAEPGVLPSLRSSTERRRGPRPSGPNVGRGFILVSQRKFPRRESPDTGSRRAFVFE